MGKNSPPGNEEIGKVAFAMPIGISELMSRTGRVPQRGDVIMLVEPVLSTPYWLPLAIIEFAGRLPDNQYKAKVTLPFADADDAPDWVWRFTDYCQLLSTGVYIQLWDE